MRSNVQSTRPPHGAIARPLGVQLVGIEEKPPWTDPALGRLFSDMRVASGYTRERLAARFDTTTGIILTLEEGRLRALPSWPVTRRVVGQYGRLLGVDMTPVLSRIRQQTAAADPSLGDRDVARTTASGALMPPLVLTLPAPRPSWSDVHARRLRQAALALPALLLVGLVFVPRGPGGIVEAGISALPAHLAASLHTIYARWSNGRRGSGNDLHWIDVADPGSRKTDKLPPGPR